MQLRGQGTVVSFTPEGQLVAATAGNERVRFDDNMFRIRGNADESRYYIGDAETPTKYLYAMDVSVAAAADSTIRFHEENYQANIDRLRPKPATAAPAEAPQKPANKLLGAGFFFWGVGLATVIVGQLALAEDNAMLRLLQRLVPLEERWHQLKLGG